MSSWGFVLAKMLAPCWHYVSFSFKCLNPPCDSVLPKTPKKSLPGMKCWCDGNCGGESALPQAVISSDLMSYAAGRLEELHDQASRTQDGAMVVFCQALLESGLKVEVIELKFFSVLWTFDQGMIDADLYAHYLPLVHSTWLFVHQRSVFTCKTQSSEYI